MEKASKIASHQPGLQLVGLDNHMNLKNAERQSNQKTSKALKMIPGIILTVSGSDQIPKADSPL